MARLSVNLNKIALLRNSRRTGVPDPVAFVVPAREAGARGITLHPRPDERHVRRDDVMRIAAEMASWRPDFELNLEGFPDERFLALVEEVRPEQCTLVPDPPGVLTSDKGWDLDASEVGQVGPAVDRLRRIGCRVVLFIDPDPNVPDRVADLGADGVEVYTGAYADHFRRGAPGGILERTAETARRAGARGLVVNAGHDLNLKNIPPLVAAVPLLAEASIGHELTADALTLGFPSAVAEYAGALAASGAGAHGAR